MSKTGKRPLRTMSANEKLAAIHRVHDGESKASVARDIGVPESTLRGWCKNEDKIVFLSRQSSSPESDGAVPGTSGVGSVAVAGGGALGEPKEKRAKIDEPVVQPFNLSLRQGSISFPSTSKSLYTPLDYSRNDADTAHKTPQNLCLKTDTPKSSATATITSAAQMTDQELRRAELARLSIELGLNRPEMFPSTSASTSTNNTTNTTMNDLTQNLTLINAWNSLMMQQQLIQNGQQTKKMTNSEYLTLANSLLQSLPAITSMTKNNNRSTKEQPPQQQQSTDDYIKSWLKIQEAAAVTAAVAANHATNSHNKTQMVAHNNSTTATSTITSATPSVRTLSPGTITATTSSINSCNNLPATTSTATTTNLEALYQNTLWKWSKELTQNQINKFQQQQQQHDNKPILYQQLTKDGNDNVVKVPNGKKVKNGNKIRTILDNLLINNNNHQDYDNDANKQTNSNETISRDEALVHGERFMQWLEQYSDPMVTALQLTQFRNLLNNIRLSANRHRNGDNFTRNKTKERRK